MNVSGTKSIGTVVATLILALCGCSGAAAPANSQAVQSQLKPKQSSNMALDETLFSVQKKVVRTERTSSGKEYSLIVTQYVIYPQGDRDDRNVCVGDNDHCITVKDLNELLHRPKNDPLGILK
jgi:hypothetical protein